jgi:hypothetical protein
MKRISMLAIAVMTVAASLILGAVSASASSGPTTEVAKSGHYESVVSCPQWAGSKGGVHPLLNLPYSPTTVTGNDTGNTKNGTHGGAKAYDPLVTCSVTFLQQAPAHGPLALRDALFHVDPGLADGPAGDAIEHACAHAPASHRLMVTAAKTCCAWNATISHHHDPVMYTCCGQVKAPNGRMSYVCCTTPRSGHLHGRMLFTCCADLHAVAAFMPSCVVLNTGFGGMAKQVAHHQPAIYRRRG